MTSANDNRARPAPRVFVEFRPPMRTMIEDAIESLLLLLDEIDGDADFEGEPFEEDPAELEPSLGSIGGMDQSNWGRGSTDDTEFEDEREPEEYV